MATASDVFLHQARCPTVARNARAGREDVMQRSEERWVMTILEARVAPENWNILKQSYQDQVARGIPAQMLQTYLVQDAVDRDRWQIVSFWASREALDYYRRSVELPAGLVIFRAAGAEPIFSIFDVNAI
jgi:hypothetical protein